MNQEQSIQSMGGKARADKLSPEERSESARTAALAKWDKIGARGPMPKATHEGILRIGNVEISCAVLEDGQRVLSQAEFLEALGRHRKANVRKEETEGEEPMPPILQGKAIKPFILPEIAQKSRPFNYRTLSGARASGYRADLLPSVCEVYLQARDAGVLPHNQELSESSPLLMRQPGFNMIAHEKT
jgi:hypothetical protein